MIVGAQTLCPRPAGLGLATAIAILNSQESP